MIMDADKARARGLTSTVTFPVGNLAPEGSVIKSTAIDPSVVDEDGVYRNTGPARVFRSEHDAIRSDQEPGRRPDQGRRHHGADVRRSARHRHGGGVSR